MFWLNLLHPNSKSKYTSKVWRHFSLELEHFKYEMNPGRLCLFLTTKLQTCCLHSSKSPMIILLKCPSKFSLLILQTIYSITHSYFCRKTTTKNEIEISHKNHGTSIDNGTAAQFYIWFYVRILKDKVSPYASS